eukprot:jgi/Psemu1/70253/estExt_Genemark1.C_16250002
MRRVNYLRQNDYLFSIRSSTEDIMMNRNASFHRKIDLLLLLLAGTAAAATSLERDNSGAKRDLIGFNQILHLVPTPPTMYPTAAAPTPYPVGKPGQDTPPVYPSPTTPTPTPYPVVPGVPTKFPTSPPTPFPTRAPIESASASPTSKISEPPSDGPSLAPITIPSETPTVRAEPREAPTVSEEPSEKPTITIEETTSEPSQEPSAVSIIQGRNGNTADEAALKEVTGTNEGRTIADMICDVDNAKTWGTLCVVLHESGFLPMLGDSSGQFTLFAPTNIAFSIGDHALEVLFKDNASLQNLVSIHITPLALSYSALVCDSGAEMLNFDMTFTICIGSVKFQTAEGNEIRNLPVIEDGESIEATNGFIHSVSHLILPVDFSINHDVTEHSPWSDVFTATEDNFQTVDEGRLNATDTVSDDLESEDIEESNADKDLEESVDMEHDSESVLVEENEVGVTETESPKPADDSASPDVDKDLEESNVDMEHDSKSVPVEENEVGLTETESPEPADDSASPDVDTNIEESNVDMEHDSESVLVEENEVGVTETESAADDSASSDVNTNLEESSVEMEHDSESVLVEENEVGVTETESAPDDSTSEDSSINFHFDFGCQVCESQELYKKKVAYSSFLPLAELFKTNSKSLV